MHFYDYPHNDIGVKSPGCAARGSETRSAEILFAELRVKDKGKREKSCNF